MRNLILGGLALAASLAAYPAAAGNVRFTLSPSDYDGALTWVLPQSPAPDFSDETSFELNDLFFGEGHDPVEGDALALFGGFTFYTEEGGGGFLTEGLVLFGGGIPFFLDLSGDQLFTGTPDAPTFRLGTFLLHDSPCGCGPLAAAAVGDYTLTIGEAVPEPATWAFMIAGFGLAGVALRRRAVVA